MNNFLKWLATFSLIIGTFINSAESTHMLTTSSGPFVLMFGGVMWLIVSIRWRESALIVTNGFVVLAGVVPFAIKYFS